MTGGRQRHDRTAFDVLSRVLAECKRDGATGTLHLVGNPGGTFHLRKGAVVAVDSPGAPGADALLLGSGRISEADWTAALRAGAEARSFQAELVAGGTVGSTELQVGAVMAARDRAFAAVAGVVEDYIIDGELVEVLLPIVPGVDADCLLWETVRRLDALAALPFPVSPYRERMAPVHGIDLSESRLTVGQREILACADGRRNARDIAFMVGRGLYPVTVEISRMLSEGLMEVVPSSSVAVWLPAPVVVRPAGGRANCNPDGADGSTYHLPRRLAGASGITEALTIAQSSGWHGLSPRSRLFTRIREGLPTASTSETAGGSLNQKGNARES